MNVNPTAPNLDKVLRQQLTDGAHELRPRVNLKELRPPQGTPLVNPSKAIGDLCRSLASQGVSLFVAAGDVNDRESVTEGFPSYAVMWQKEHIGLTDLDWHRQVKLRPWNVSWSRQIDRIYHNIGDPCGYLYNGLMSINLYMQEISFFIFLL